MIIVSERESRVSSSRGCSLFFPLHRRMTYSCMRTVKEGVRNLAVLRKAGGLGREQGGGVVGIEKDLILWQGATLSRFLHLH